MSKAKQAIVEEAKQVGDDMRDIAGGVREGMQLTKQDLEDWAPGSINIELHASGLPGYTAGNCLRFREPAVAIASWFRRYPFKIFYAAPIKR